MEDPLHEIRPITLGSFSPQNLGYSRRRVSAGRLSHFGSRTVASVGHRHTGQRAFRDPLRSIHD